MKLPSPQPRCSVIIPVFDGWEVTQRCLESIRATTPGGAAEVIVVDNASSDATPRELARLAAGGRVKGLRNERNESYAHANNQGAALSAAPLLVFLNNDTVLLPGWLEALERTFEAEPSVGVQGGKLLYPDGRIQHAGIVYGPVNAEGLLLHYHLHLLQDRDAPCVNSAREFQMVTGALLVIRRELFNRVGGFDEQYYFGHEDMDLCMKVRDAGCRVWYNPLASAVHFESVTKKLRGIEKFERYVTHPNSFDAANDRLFHRKWDGVLEVDADRYYRADGLPSPLGVSAAPRDGERKLRILMTMFGWTETGGGTTFPRAFAKRLARHGHTVSVFSAAGRHSATGEPYLLETSEDEGVTVFGLFNRATTFLDQEDPDREVQDPRAVAAFSKVLRSVKPDLVHLHNLLGLSFGIAAAAKAAGVPVLYTPHNYHVIDPMLYMIGGDLEPWKGVDLLRNSALPCLRPDLVAAYTRRMAAARTMLHRDVDCVLAGSRRVRDLLVEFGSPPERTFVVHLVHETTEAIVRRKRARRPVRVPVRFGYLGGVMPHKGVHLIAAAAQTLPAGAATFAIHGFVTDDYRRTLEALDRNHLLTLAGPYSADDLPHIANDIDVMILPSLWEDLGPITATEALAMGTPVIAPGIGGFPDFIRDGWNGRIFPSGDRVALEGILREIVSDPSMVERWAVNATLPASFEDHVRHVESLYAAMLKGATPNVLDENFLLFPDVQPPVSGAAGEPFLGAMNRNRIDGRIQGGFSNNKAIGTLPDPLPSPLYLNVGCGEDTRKGFVNIDLFSDDPSVVQMDIRRLGLPDNSVDGLVAHDVLEHFSHREVDAVLREWARVLKPGAEYMIRCPSLALQCKAYMNGTWNADVASLMIFGGQTNPGDYHCVGFDRTSITNHLEAAGLRVTSVREDDVPQDRGFINLSLFVKGRKAGAATTARNVRTGRKDTGKAIHVLWEGEQFVHHSLALVNRELCLRLAARPGIELGLEGTGKAPEKTGDRLTPLRERSGHRSSGTPDVHVRHLWPANLEPPAAGHWVVIQPWEYGSLPRQWVEAYRETVDEFWVPSTFVRDCYVQSGIAAERVVVIPNGVDGNAFRPGVRPLSLTTRKRFKFLFVGGTLHRKGFDLLLEAYGRAFGKADDVCLIVKDMGGPALYEGVNACDLIREFTADPSHPAIEYIDRTLSEEEMPGLYAAADCLVHPYRGEGFGLPIAEAMAAELPVIVTGAGAAVDFASEETAFLLPARKGRLANRSIGGVETVDYPWLFEPDGDELVRLMQYVRTHKGETKKKARAARRHVLAALSWEKAAELVVSRLEAIRQTPIRRQVAPGRGGETPREPMTTGSNQPDARIQAALRRAGELEEQGKRAEAEAVFTALARTFPSEQAVALAHTRYLLGTKQFEQASRVITETPMALKSDSAWLELTALCLEGTGEAESAEECALKILERSPRSVCALTLRGRLSIRRGDTEQAERRFREAINADPAAGEPCALLGALLLQQGRAEEGLSMLESGFQLLPGSGDILVTMVEAFRVAGRLSRAGELVEQAVREHPRNKRLRFFLAEILAGLERPTESLQVVLGCLAEFGVEDEALAFALNLRLAIGPMSVPQALPKGPAVSACLIIKNEEQYLARCLWSILPIVHEIIVVDTGSSDRSEEIAAAFGAKVFHAPWNNDFSDARNRSLEPASGDWILVLDGDEVLSTADHEAFRALIARGGKRTAYSFVTRNYLIPMNVIGWTANDGKYSEEAGSGWIPSEKTRLFPRKDGVRFENPVHELVEPSLQAAGIRVVRAKIPVHHYGKLDAAKTKEKAEVYLELGRKKLAEAGTDDIKAMFELAFQENDLGNYEEALRLYRRIRELNPSIPKVHFAIGANLGTLGRHEEAVPALERSIALDPDLKEAYVHLALSRLALGDREGALAAAEGLAALKIDYPPGVTLLAATRFVCSDAEGGRMALQPLEQRGLSFLQYFTELARHLRSEGRPEFAARLLEPFVAGEQTPQDLAMLLVDCYRDMAMATNLHEQPA